MTFIAVAATPLFLVAVTIVGALTPGYDHTSDTISRLGSPGQPHALLTSALFVGYGALLVVVAETCSSTRACSLIRIYGVAAAVAGLAPKDLPGTSHTMQSDVHVLATIVGGAAIVGAMFVTRSHRMAIVTMLTALAFRLSWGTEWYGSLERTLLVIAGVWLLAQTSTGSRRSSPVSSSSTRRQPHSSASSGSPSDGPEAITSSPAWNRNAPRGR